MKKSGFWMVSAVGVATIGWMAAQALGESGGTATLGKPARRGAAAPTQAAHSGGQTVTVSSSSTNSHVHVRTSITGPDGKTVVREYNSDGNGSPVAGPAAAGGEKTRSIGVETRPIDETLRAQLDIEPETGLAISSVLENGPAAKAGLQKTDVLLRVGDQILVEPQQFAKLLRRHKAGDEVEITYLRRGKQAKAKVKVEEIDAPADVPDFGNISVQGIDLNELMKQLPNLQSGNLQSFGFATNFTFQTNISISGPGINGGGTIQVITVPGCSGTNP